MIIYTIQIQDGERQYTEWGYYETFTIEQYENGELLDREILSEFYGIDFGDNDYFDKDREKYWNDTSCVWIDSVEEITPEHLEIIKRYL